MNTSVLLLYYITDRSQFPGTESERCHKLLQKVAEAAAWGVDLVQLREKDLAARELEGLAREALRRLQAARTSTRLLINSRVDVALAVGAHGVHLRSRDISVEEVRTIWRLAAGRATPIVSVSCHSAEEVHDAREAGADYAVFAPVFEKTGSAEFRGLEGLRQACRHPIPVLALGGIRVENAGSCIQAGAKGIAAIRLFQENELKPIIDQLAAVQGRVI